MRKISEIISKEIISVFEGEKIGTVKNITFSNNYKKIKSFVFFDDECEFESEVLSKNVYNATEDGVLIRNLSKVSNDFIVNNNPMNTSVFLLNGTGMGKISDICFDENFNVMQFNTSMGKSFLPNQILKMGFDVCIIKNDSAKISVAAFKPPTEFAPKTQILENLQVKLVRLNPTEDTQNFLPALPIKVKPNINALIGKTATKTITGLNNEVIIRQHAVISKHTLEMAKTHNKTHELIFNTLQ
jgi:sporulation protein YlmC with PRC-barrel domain